MDISEKQQKCFDDYLVKINKGSAHRVRMNQQIQSKVNKQRCT